MSVTNEEQRHKKVATVMIATAHTATQRELFNCIHQAGRTHTQCHQYKKCSQIAHLVTM